MTENYVYLPTVRLTQRTYTRRCNLSRKIRLSLTKEKWKNNRRYGVISVTTKYWQCFDRRPKLAARQMLCSITKIWLEHISSLYFLEPFWTAYQKIFSLNEIGNFQNMECDICTLLKYILSVRKFELLVYYPWLMNIQIRNTFKWLNDFFAQTDHS